MIFINVEWAISLQLFLCFQKYYCTSWFLGGWDIKKNLATRGTKLNFERYIVEFSPATHIS